MIDFLDHMAFACLAGAAIGTILLLWVGVCNFVDYLSEGKLSEWIIKLFKE